LRRGAGEAGGVVWVRRVNHPGASRHLSLKRRGRENEENPLLP